MPAAHRQDDSRSCGATTIVTGQGTVYIENKLFSVEGDPNTHGSGALIAAGSTVFVNSKKVIVVGDTASPDDLCIPLGGAHCAPAASSGSGTVSVY